MTEEQEGLKGGRILCSLLLLHNPDAQSSVWATPPNANTETARVAAVTGVRDTLNTALETSDTTWGNTLTNAGTALGSTLDGIADFDWQHVRDYVGAVSGARQAAEVVRAPLKSFIKRFPAGSSLKVLRYGFDPVRCSPMSRLPLSYR